MKNILITGGAGFIGSNVALRLLQKGYYVTVLDNLSKQIHGVTPEITSPLYLSIKDKVRFIHGSVVSREDWMKALDGQDAVIHLAAETGTGQSMYQIEKYVDTNIGGTALLLDILTNTKHHVKRVMVKVNIIVLIAVMFILWDEMMQIWQKVTLNASVLSVVEQLNW